MATPERTHAAAHAGYGRSGSAMPPRASGAIETHAWRDGRTVTIRARVRAYGRRYRVDFGTNHEGWSVERARVELDRTLQQVERGTWDPPSSVNRVRADPLEQLEIVDHDREVVAAPVDPENPRACRTR
jgi:hypothetical protein